MNELWSRSPIQTSIATEPFGQRLGQAGVVERDARWVGAILAWSGSLLLVVIVVVEVTSPARECISLWNAPDNSKVRAAVAAGGSRYGALTAYTAEGEPGRVCYMTMLDGIGEPRGTFVIWPDNLFDNGALHDYHGPTFHEEGYLGHPLSRTPTVTVAADGRVQGL